MGKRYTKSTRVGTASTSAWRVLGTETIPAAWKWHFSWQGQLGKSGMVQSPDRIRNSLKIKCRGRGSNPHGAKLHRILSPVRLPVSPPRHGSNINHLRGSCSRLTSPDRPIVTVFVTVTSASFRTPSRRSSPLDDVVPVEHRPTRGRAGCAERIRITSSGCSGSTSRVRHGYTARQPRIGRGTGPPGRPPSPIDAATGAPRTSCPSIVPWSLGEQREGRARGLAANDAIVKILRDEGFETRAVPDRSFTHAELRVTGQNRTGLRDRRAHDAATALRTVSYRLRQTDGRPGHEAAPDNRNPSTV